jgi:transcriptional regulator with XRE-family HTH domain
MATRESRFERGRRRGRSVASRLINELVATRQSLNLSQRAIADSLHASQGAQWRLEHMTRLDSVTFVELAEMASMLGLELGAALYSLGDPIRDAGHQALIRRFRAILAQSIKVVAEVPLPNPGDRRSWDLLLRIESQRVGVEAETRIRDAQALVRRMREREADGGTDEVLLVLAESAINRRLLPGLLEALGSRFVTPPRATLRALRVGAPIPGSGVVLV